MISVYSKHASSECLVKRYDYFYLVTTQKKDNSRNVNVVAGVGKLT